MLYVKIKLGAMDFITRKTIHNYETHRVLEEQRDYVLVDFYGKIIALKNNDVVEVGESYEGT